MVELVTFNIGTSNEVHDRAVSCMIQLSKIFFFFFLLQCFVLPGNEWLALYLFVAQIIIQIFPGDGHKLLSGRAQGCSNCQMKVPLEDHEVISGCEMAADLSSVKWFPCPMSDQQRELRHPDIADCQLKMSDLSTRPQHFYIQVQSVCLSVCLPSCSCLFVFIAIFSYKLQHKGVGGGQKTWKLCQAWMSSLYCTYYHSL